MLIQVPIAMERLGTHGNTDEEHEKQVQERPRAADCGQCVVSHKFSDDNAVNCIIELLRNIADQHGNHEKNDIACRRSDCHINRLEQITEFQICLPPIKHDSV